MIYIIYLVLGFFWLRDLLRPSWLGQSSLYPVLRLLVVLQGLLILAQMWSMTQVDRHQVFELMAYAPLLLLLISVREGESLKLFTVLWPLSFCILSLSFFMDNFPLLSPSAAEHARSVFLHISLALGGYASFLLVMLCAAVYLWQRYLLKKHNNAPVLHYMPSLIDLNIMQWRALWAGILLLTLGIGLGKLSPYLWSIPHRWGVKEILSVLIWVHYLLLALFKKRFLLNKERFAQFSLLGLVLVLSTFFFLGLGDLPDSETSVPSKTSVSKEAIPTKIKLHEASAASNTLQHGGEAAR